MNEPLTITILGTPRTKKNNQIPVTNKATGRTMILQSKAYREYERDSIGQIAKTSAYGMKIDTPVNVRCLFYMPTRRVVDLSNLLSAISDVLVRGEVLADDNSRIIRGYDGSRVLYDKENPRTEVFISGESINET